MIAALLIAAAACCAPLSVVDDVGTTVVLESIPSRIVCISPGATEILYAIGAQRSIVGVSTMCDYPKSAAKLPSVGEFYAPSVEAILALRPGLVVSTGGAQRDLVLRLRQGSIPVLVMYPSGLEGVWRDISVLGEATGRSKAAGGLAARLKARVGRLTAPLAGIPPASRPRVYFELSADPPMTFGDSSYVGELIRLAGGVNIAASAAGDYPRLSAETILAANPDVILLSHCGRPGRALDEVAARPGWAGLKAVRTGCVWADLDMDCLLRPGPRLVDGLEALIKRIHSRPAPGRRHS